MRLDRDANNGLTNMVDAAGTTKFTWFAGGLMENEDLPSRGCGTAGGPWANHTVSLGHSNRLRIDL